MTPKLNHLSKFTVEWSGLKGRYNIEVQGVDEKGAEVIFRQSALFIEGAEGLLRKLRVESGGVL